MDVPDELPDLDNPRNEEGRVLCPVCRKPIRATEPTFRVGDQALHFSCLEQVENESAPPPP